MVMMKNNLVLGAYISHQNVGFCGRRKLENLQISSEERQVAEKWGNTFPPLSKNWGGGAKHPLPLNSDF